MRRNKAFILFTRIPLPGKTKTRMMPYLRPEECAALQTCFLRDLKNEIGKAGADIFICYSAEGELSALKDIFGYDACFFEQEGDDLGARMSAAFRHVFAMGYRSCILTGSDIPELRSKDIREAFRKLGRADVVTGPSSDGGYYLIGMKKLHSCLFDGKRYGQGSVLGDLEKSAASESLSCERIRMLSDIDTPADLAGFRARMRKSRRLRNTETGRFAAGYTTVSIIVPVYNEQKTIDSMVTQLEALKGDCEVIIVDGGSSDGTAGMIPEDLTLIHSAKGRARQMNAGAEMSSGDVLFFLHCDSELPPDPLSEIRHVISGREAGCFGIAFRSKQFFMWTNRLISNGRARIHGIMFGDQGIFVTRELFDRVGGFREIPVMEDYQFSLDLRKLGIRPGMAGQRIYTSDRRYPKANIPKLRLMHQMYRLRKEYRAGVPAEEIAEKYRDIR